MKSPKEVIEEVVDDCIYLEDNNSGVGLSARIDRALTDLREIVLKMKKKGITWKGSFDKCSRADRYKIRINEVVDDIADLFK